jgi:excisionase family DNA binding protein
MFDALLTTEDMSHLLRVSTRTLDNHITAGHLPKSIKIGRRRYWHRDVVDAWLREKAGIAQNDTDTH